MTKPLLKQDRFYTVHLSRINKFTGPQKQKFPDYLAARRFAKGESERLGVRADIYNRWGRRLASYGR